MANGTPLLRVAAPPRQHGRQPAVGSRAPPRPRPSPLAWLGALAAAAALAGWAGADRAGAFAGLAPRPAQKAFSPLHQGGRSAGAGVAMEAEGKFRALTRIRIRTEPDTKAELTGERVEPGEVFEVDEVKDPPKTGGSGYLKLSAPKSGWIFDTGIAGAWVDKPIVESVAFTAPVTAPAAASPAEAAEAAEAAAPAAEATEATEAAEAAPAAASEEAEGEEEKPAASSVPIGRARVETLRLPGNMLGSGFEIVRIEGDNVPRPMNFLLNNGFPANVLTQAGRELLPGAGEKAEFKGGWMSKAKEEAKIAIKSARFEGTGTKIGDLDDLEILDFPQAQICEMVGVQIHGMLGRPFFEKYDVDLDRYGQNINLFEPGGASGQGFYSSVKYLKGLGLPSGNMGVTVSAKVPDGDTGKFKEVSFLGIISTGDPYSIINWEAAKLLGYEGKKDPLLSGVTKVLGANTKGETEEMPVILQSFQLGGVKLGVKSMMVPPDSKEAFEKEGGLGWYFENIGSEATQTKVKFGAVNICIGDSLGLAILDDSKIGPYTGAAAIIGQDLLFQVDRLVLNSGDRELWLQQPEEIRDQDPM